MARRAKKSCPKGRVKSGPRKGRCRTTRVRRNACKGKSGVEYQQCRHEVSMANARRLLK